MKVDLTPGAGADLRAIKAFIARHDPRAAVTLVKQIRIAIDGLRSFPHRGRPGPLAGTRELVVRSYLILYRIDAGRIEILAVRHGAQRPLTILPD